MTIWGCITMEQDSMIHYWEGLSVRIQSSLISGEDASGPEFRLTLPWQATYTGLLRGGVCLQVKGWQRFKKFSLALTDNLRDGECLDRTVGHQCVYPAHCRVGGAEVNSHNKSRNCSAIGIAAGGCGRPIRNISHCSVTSMNVKTKKAAVSCRSGFLQALKSR